MKSFNLSVPSKVFLAGEYLALSGGVTLLVGVEPRFNMHARENGSQNKNPFHPNSPAGKLWEIYRAQLNKFQIEFSDPHHGSGGFGGSTAEFALLYALLQMQLTTSVDAQSDIDIHAMLKLYRELATTTNSTQNSAQNYTQNYTPSGADLIAQFRGGLTLFSKELGKVQNYPWLFTNLGLVIAKTKFKLKTHEHLMTLQHFESAGLQSAMKLVQEGLDKTDSHLFIQGMQSFSKELIHLDFVAEETSQILNSLNHHGVLIKKGCGAMGADVILLIHDKNLIQTEQLFELCQKQGLAVIATEKQMSAGLEIKAHFYTDSHQNDEELHSQQEQIYL